MTVIKKYQKTVTYQGKRFRIKKADRKNPLVIYNVETDRIKNKRDKDIARIRKEADKKLENAYQKSLRARGLK